MSAITIVRTGPKHHERAVRVNQCNGSGWWINPQTEVNKATGCYFGRASCIVSFADGLASAGNEVWIFDGRSDRPVQHYLHRNFGGSLHVYWLLGRLWIVREWVRFVDALGRYRIPMGEPRQLALEETARHYIAHPWDRSIKLILPVS